MTGIKKLRKLQLGRETTAGTAVNATDLWRGIGTIEDQTEVMFPEEDIGYLSGSGAHVHSQRTGRTNHGRRTGDL